MSKLEQITVTYIDCTGTKHTTGVIMHEMGTSDAVKCCYDALTGCDGFARSSVLDAMEQLIAEQRPAE